MPLGDQIAEALGWTIANERPNCQRQNKLLQAIESPSLFSNGLILFYPYAAISASRHINFDGSVLEIERNYSGSIIMLPEHGIPYTLLDRKPIAFDKDGRVSFNILQHHRSQAHAILFVPST